MTLEALAEVAVRYYRAVTRARFLRDQREAIDAPAPVPEGAISFTDLYVPTVDRAREPRG